MQAVIIPDAHRTRIPQGFVCTLLIKLMQANPMLRDKLCKVVAIKDIISSVIFIIIEDFSLRRGYMGAATLLLYLLSEEPNFGRVLNLPADKLPTTMPLPYGGTWFDAMIVLTHHMASSEVGNVPVPLLPNPPNPKPAPVGQTRSEAEGAQRKDMGGGCVVVPPARAG